MRQRANKRAILTSFWHTNTTLNNAAEYAVVFCDAFGRITIVCGKYFTFFPDSAPRTRVRCVIEFSMPGRSDGGEDRDRE